MSVPSRNRSHRGLTLIEAAVAIGLLGLLVAAALAATSTGLEAWLATRKAAEHQRQEASWEERLQAAVAAMIPMETPWVRRPGYSRVYFRGEPALMSFVTAHSPARAGRWGLRLVQLAFEPPGEKRRLVLREWPCPDVSSLAFLLAAPSAVPERAPEGRLSAAGIGAALSRTSPQGCRNCEFRYLEDAGSGSSEGAWLSRWDRPGELPRAVRIQSRPQPAGLSGAGSGEAREIEFAGVVRGERGLDE